MAIPRLPKMLHCYVLDPCKEKACDFYGNCISKPDRTVDCVCPVCQPKYNIICANDGTNYASLCWMKRAACKQKKTLTVSQESPCGMFHSQLTAN